MAKALWITIMAGLAAASVGTPAQAAPAVKPGLWEMTFNSKMTGAELPPGAGSNSMTMKICIRPEHAKSNWQDMIKHMQGEGQNDCTISDMKESGGNYSFVTKCKSGMSGNMKGSIAPTTMKQSGDMTFADESTPMRMTFDQSGRWLADTCPPGTPGSE